MSWLKSISYSLLEYYCHLLLRLHLFSTCSQSWMFFWILHSCISENPSTYSVVMHRQRSTLEAMASWVCTVCSEWMCTDMLSYIGHPWKLQVYCCITQIRKSFSSAVIHKYSSLSAGHLARYYTYDFLNSLTGHERCYFCCLLDILQYAAW